jgi:hypothetical protein
MDWLLAAILELLQPLRYADGPQRVKTLLTALGYALPEDVLPPAPPLDFAATLSQSLALAARLQTAATWEEKLAALQEAESLVRTVWGGAQDLRDTLATAFTAIPQFLEKTDFQATAPKRLLDYLVIRYLQKKSPRAQSIMDLLGVTASTPQVENLAEFQSECNLLSLHLERVPALIQSPLSLADDLYEWESGFDGSLFLSRLALVMRMFGMPGNLLPDDNPDYKTDPDNPEPDRQLFYPLLSGGFWPDTYWQFGLRVQAAEAEGAQKKGLAIIPYAQGQVGASVALNERISLLLTVDANLENGIGVFLRPPATLDVQQDLFSQPVDSVDTGISLELVVSGADEDVVLLGSTDGSRLTADALSLKGSISVQSGESDLGLEMSLPDWALVVDPGEGDSFLKSLLGALPLQVGGDLLLGYSLKQGFYISSGSGLSLDIPLNKTLGPFTISDVTLGLALEDASFLIQTTLTGSVSLGPFAFVLENVGLSSGLDWDAADGLLGSLDAYFQFKPPEGIGLAVDAGPVSGGGYLSIDPDSGHYNGVLELDLFSIGINAVTLIDTDLPDGGWSFFLALFIDVPEVPLGFGFNLTGLGGLAGVNRALDVDGLQSAIRSGALNSILFPADPIEDAPAIIAGLQDIFPSASGRYVFGPVVQIGWGEPTLIEAVIGVVISLPDPIVIAVIGSLSSILPSKDIDLVALYLDVAGVVDLGAATLSIDASLHCSHIAGFPLSGDMALRGEFGEAPSFLMALGGCHPGFDRPADFPVVERLALAINAGDQIDIRFDCYFAISSNTLQFGAAFELNATVEGFGIKGGAEFDALINLSPFSLDVSLGYHVSVAGAGVDLLAVWLDVSLSGPNPWHVVGTATITILGIDAPLNLDQTIGAKKPEPPPAAEDVRGQLRAALALPEAWSIASSGGSGVTFSAGGPLDGELVVAPDGTLAVSQRVAPLGITLDKSVPWQIAGGYNRFDLAAKQPGLASSGSLVDWFVVSSYQDLDSRERLSAPSFEQLKSGIQFGGGSPTAGTARQGTLVCEQILLDPELAELSRKSSFHLNRDARAASLGKMATGQAGDDFRISAEDDPIAVVSSPYVLADELSGAVVETHASWSASHAARQPGMMIAPAWENLP